MSISFHGLSISYHFQGKPLGIGRKKGEANASPLGLKPEVFVVFTCPSDRVAGRGRPAFPIFQVLVQVFFVALQILAIGFQVLFLALLFVRGDLALVGADFSFVVSNLTRVGADLTPVSAPIAEIPFEFLALFGTKDFDDRVVLV